MSEARGGKFSKPDYVLVLTWILNKAVVLWGEEQRRGHYVSNANKRI